jgi:hypothetical protein
MNFNGIHSNSKMLLFLDKSGVFFGKRNENRIAVVVSKEGNGHMTSRVRFHWLDKERVSLVE